ncbi:MAG: PilN domain-containing protein [Phycisphaerales bacterium]
MINNRKAIGIDVCMNTINVVRLERNGDKITLADCMQIPFDNDANNPDSSINAKKLTAALKTLKLTTRLEHCDASVCFNSLPDLLQILRLPETTPHNIIKYIHDEIRQYAVLPLKNIKTDYCALRTSGGADAKQVLVGACQTLPLIEISQELESIQIDVRLIEPAVISLVRACYKNIINASSDKNIMLALLRDDVFNICVFNGSKLDFLRTKKLEIDSSQQNSCVNAIAEQFESVFQFYELEKTFDKSNWRVFLNCNQNTQQAVSISEQLKNIIADNIEISPVLPQHLNLSVKTENKDFSAVAVGAAMKILDANDSEISINMIPDEISEIRKSNKNLLTIINTAAVILILLFLHIAQLTIRSTRADEEIAKRAKLQNGISISELSRACADANEQTKNLTAHIQSLEMILPQSCGSNWAYILAEICTKAPQTVQIKNLQTGSLNSLTIEGVAVNYEGVKEFLNNLSNCKTITSPQLEDTKQNTQYGDGFIDYSINCRLVEKK